MAQNDQLQFTMSKKASMLVVHISGTFGASHQNILEQLLSELEQDQSLRFIVLEMSQLETINLDAIPTFVQFQKSVRAKEHRLCLCAMSEDLKRKLVKLGITRANELASSLKDAVELFVRESKQAAVTSAVTKKAS